MGASILRGGKLVHVPAREVAVIDLLGAGDAFTAGVLNGYLNGDIRSGLEQGAVLSALILSQHGDILVTTPEDVRSILEGPSNTLNC